MINANELRLGNLISHNGIEFIVTGIDSIIITATTLSIPIKSGDINAYDNIEGIRLTEQLLLNFGFKKYDASFRKGRFTLFINMNLNGGTGHTNELLIQGVCIAHPYYVHQLQNLFFTLTGRELELKKEVNT